MDNIIYDDHKDESIMKFVDDINKHYKKKNKKYKNKNIYENNESCENKKLKKFFKNDNDSSFKIINFFIVNFKDPIIIIILYVLLSQNFIKKFVGKYINEINPSDNNNVSLFGVIIYGSILAFFFTITKKYADTLLNLEKKHKK